MPVVQDAFYIPESIMTGILTGKYRRIGGVVRVAAGPGKGQIVKILDPVKVAENKSAESLAAKGLRVVRTHKKAFIVGGIIIVAAGTGAFIYHKVKSQEPEVLKNFRTVLGKYINAIREGTMTLELINEMTNALEELKHHKDYGQFVIELKVEDMEVLVDKIHDYTLKLASDNGVAYDDSKRNGGNAVTELESYLKVQKKVFERAA